MKGGGKVGKARQRPPFAHTMGMKCGKKVGIVRESPPFAHAIDMKNEPKLIFQNDQTLELIIIEL